METQTKHHLTVGFFMGLGLLVTMLLILGLGGDQYFSDESMILYTTFDHAQGLNKGSIVSLSGIKIGNVQNITLSTTREVQVKMKIRSIYSQDLRQGSIAEIRTQGALGDKFVFITPSKSPRSVILKNGEMIPSKTDGDLMSLLSEKGKEATKIFDLIGELESTARLFNKDERTDRILDHLTRASSNVEDMTVLGRALMIRLSKEMSSPEGGSKIRSALTHLDSILGKIDRGEGTLGELVNSSSLHDQIRAVLGGSGGIDKKKYLRTLVP